MCYIAKRSPEFRANQRLLTLEKLSPEEERIVEQFMRDFGRVLTGPQRDLVDAVRAGDVDLSRLDEIRAEVTAAFGNYSGEIQAVYREHAAAGMATGRTLAAQRYDLTGSFDVVPQRLLDQLDDWAIESTDEVVDTMSDDVARVLRSGAEEGLGTDEIAEILDEDVFEGRLKDSHAETVARTELNSASNTGAHSAYEDAEGVIAEEWLAAAQPGRTRDAHLEANGQIVPVDGTFLIAGEEMLHPGDKSASIELWANCRCTAAPVFADQLTPAQVETIRSGGRILA